MSSQPSGRDPLIIDFVSPPEVQQDSDGVEFSVFGQNFTESCLIFFDGASPKPTIFVGSRTLKTTLTRTITGIPGQKHVLVHDKTTGDISNDKTLEVVPRDNQRQAYSSPRSGLQVVRGMEVTESIGALALAKRDLTVDDTAALLLALPKGAKADVKVADTFSPDPWVIAATDGTPLATIESMVVTYVRVVDPAGGPTVFYVTLQFFGTGHKRFPRTGSELHLLSQPGASGLLDDWTVGVLDVRCNSNHELHTYRKDFNTDFFDAVQQVTLVVMAGTWYPCPGS